MDPTSDEETGDVPTGAVVFPPTFDTTVPHSARAWDYWLGGKDHYPVDREFGETVVEVYPAVVDAVRASRAFLARAVRSLAGQGGVRQFLDIGVGLPRPGDNTHEVAQRVAPECRVVYVDNDPLALVHACALLAGTPEGAVGYVDADVRAPETILSAAAQTLDFSRPVAVVLACVLGHRVRGLSGRRLAPRGSRAGWGAVRPSRRGKLPVYRGRPPPAPAPPGEQGPAATAEVYAFTATGRGRGVGVPPSIGDRPAAYADAVDAYLTCAGIAASSRRVYRVSLATWAWLARGEQPPPGPARRGAGAPPLTLADLERPETPAVLAAAFAARAAGVGADTANRELSVLGAALGWWRDRGWLAADPLAGLGRRPASPDRTRALTREQVAALYAFDAAVREKTFWRMLYESCGRAEEILTLNVEDLVLPDKRARVTAKGGAAEWVHWQSPTARLLPRLLAGRTRGPVFLTARKAPARTPTLDVCPVTGRARLSYRRAAELFEAATRPLAHPGVTDPGELARRGGWSLHQLRHSALTHEAEDGTNTPTLLARSRHASVRSLERYARPGVDAVARHVAQRDPAARRRASQAS